MKLKYLTLITPLVLVGCGDSNVINVTPGDEVEKEDFTNSFETSEMLLKSNYHVDISLSYFGAPVGQMGYSSSIDFDNSNIKVIYSDKPTDPYYFDFDADQTSSAAYTFDFYMPPSENGLDSYNKQTFKNVSLDNGFMGIAGIVASTYGRGLDIPSGLSASDFVYSNGIYKLDNKELKYGATTFTVFDISFKEGKLLEMYTHYESHWDDVSAVYDAKMVFSRHGQVEVTLPEILK